MIDIIIKKFNESTLMIESSNRIREELSNYFSAYVENYKFMPKYKSGFWNGKIYFFDARTGQLPIGLLYKLQEFCNKGDYKYQQDFVIEQSLDYSAFNEFVKSLDIPIEPRDYQLQATYDVITKKHINISSSTSSGKSLILYLICRWMLNNKLKTLLIVPNTQLVEQIFTDFYSYGWNEVEDKVCLIYAGKQRLINRMIVISTWQSLYTAKDIELLKSYDCLCIDEMHSASSQAKAITTLAKNCVNASYRIGLSGSFPSEGTSDWYSVVGVSGKINVYSTYSSLQEAGFIVGFKILTTKLLYPIQTRMKAYESTKDIKDDDKSKETKRYAMESEFVSNLQSRNKFIMRLCNFLVGNTLLLFKNKATHGIPLYNLLKQNIKNKTVLYIDGDIDIKERVRIQHRIEMESNVILVASLGTTSVGISIKNLHNLILASGTKSKVKTIQSIGRLLRLHPTKDIVKIYDIVDDLSFKDVKNKIYFTNYSMKHHKERMKIYKENNFDVQELNYQIKEI